MNELLSKYSEEIESILEKYPPDRKRSGVIPLLYLAQRNDGAVSQQSITEIAEILGISTTEVKTIAGFYSLFHEEGEGRYRIQVCTDLPCALRGSETFLEALCERLGIGVGETTPDGLITVEAVMCLAACDKAPMFQLQGGGKIDYHEHQSVETAMELIDELRKQAAETQAKEAGK